MKAAGALAALGPWQRLAGATDEMKAVAILLIVAFHVLKDAMPSWIEGLGAFQPYVLLLNFGVDIFVLLSGFGLAWSLLNTPRIRWGRWVWRRFLRVFPLYWVVLSAALLAGHALGDGERLYVERLRVIESANIWLAYLGLHGFYRPYMYRIYGPFWFISLILMCYVAFFPLAGLIRRGRVDLLIAAGLVVALAGLFAVQAYPRAMSPVPFLAFVNFPLGAALAVLAHRAALPMGERRPIAGAFWGPALAGLLALVFLLVAARYGNRMTEFYLATRAERREWTRSPFDDARYFLFPALSAAVVFLTAALCRREVRGAARRVFAWLGRHAFEIFLVHMPLITALRADRLWPDSMSPGAAMVLGLVLSVVLAVPLRALGRLLGR